MFHVAFNSAPFPRHRIRAGVVLARRRSEVGTCCARERDREREREREGGRDEGGRGRESLKSNPSSYFYVIFAVLLLREVAMGIKDMQAVTVVTEMGMATVILD